MLGKHSEKSIQIKNLKQELKEIKTDMSDVLNYIRAINESNSYSDESVKRRKISEICTDTIYKLIIDEDKIIELATIQKTNSK